MYKKRWSFFLITIPIIFFGISILVPMITGVITSFNDWDGVGDPFEAKWVRFDNYKDAFLINDNSFGKSIFLTFRISIVLIISVNVLGIAMAFLVTRFFKGKMFFRGMFFLPNLIGGIIVGFIWSFVFRQVFQQLGFGKAWLQDAKSGFWAIVIVTTWQQAGYIMVIYVAAIQNIPIDVQEASKIDGARSFKKVFRIFMPFIMPAFTISTFLVIRNAFGIFDTVFALTKGGPNYSTQTIALDIYTTLFSFKGGAFFHIAQAKGVIYFAIVSLIACTQVYLSRRGELQ